MIGAEESGKPSPFYSELQLDPMLFKVHFTISALLELPFQILCPVPPLGLFIFFKVNIFLLKDQ